MNAAHATRLFLSVSAAAILTASGSLGGCSSTSPGTDKSTQVETNTITGEVTTLASTNLDSAFAAAKAGIAELQFTTTRDSKDALKGVLSARTADDKTVDVTLIRKSDNITEIVVSAGPINRSLAQSTMDAILRQIGK
jgi:Protein of unknown function (DUF3568)